MDTCLSVLSGNSTLTQVLSIRYLFFLFVTHHCNTYSARQKYSGDSVEIRQIVCYNKLLKCVYSERIGEGFEGVLNAGGRLRL